MCKPGRASAGIATLILDFSTSRTVTNKRLPARLPGYGVLLEQHKLTKALKVSGMGLTHHLTVQKKGAL